MLNSFNGGHLFKPSLDYQMGSFRRFQETDYFCKKKKKKKKKIIKIHRYQNYTNIEALFYMNDIFITTTVKMN